MPCRRLDAQLPTPMIPTRMFAMVDLLLDGLRLGFDSFTQRCVGRSLDHPGELPAIVAGKADPVDDHVVHAPAPGDLDELVVDRQLVSLPVAQRRPNQGPIRLNAFLPEDGL